MVRFTPKAKLNSLPLNQRAMAVVTATMSDSAPRPKTRRPAAITLMSGATGSAPNSLSRPFTIRPSGARAGISGKAVTAAPAKQMIPNSSVDFLVPMRSMITPPMSTMMMFGKL